MNVNPNQHDPFARIILPRLEPLPGSVSAVCKNLSTGEFFSYRPHALHNAASIIKLYVMAALFQGFHDGEFRPDLRLPVHREDCMPSCGVLTYLDDGKHISLRDLAELMIIVSDNTACNLLLDFLTLPRVRAFITDTLHLRETFCRRKLFDEAASARGIMNETSAADAAWLLEQIRLGRLVSPEASAAMLTMLRHQRLNGKIPFRLHTMDPAPAIAHKTGEDDGITHDCAVIEARHPLLLCLLGHDTDVPAFERAMADIAWDLVSSAGI